MDKLKYMDSEVSFSAFIAVIFSTSGLFWYGYKITFHINDISGYLISLLSGTSYMVLILQLMTAGSASNELGKEVKIQMQSFPIESAENQPKMNFRKKALLPDNNLTLWKIYVMDRSLVVSTFGTVLTYGIMIGTLGKYN
ncbi:uncharacterized protein TNCV_3241331 [Trichonephila clavipes]|nr:uncharacterized protein TNCV_3241331 [Trichonephila clavipes]